MYALLEGDSPYAGLRFGFRCPAGVTRVLTVDSVTVERLDTPELMLGTIDPFNESLNSNFWLGRTGSATWNRTDGYITLGPDSTSFIYSGGNRAYSISEPTEPVRTISVQFRLDAEAVTAGSLQLIGIEDILDGHLFGVQASWASGSTFTVVPLDTADEAAVLAALDDDYETDCSLGNPRPAPRFEGTFGKWYTLVIEPTASGRALFIYDTTSRLEASPLWIGRPLPWAWNSEYRFFASSSGGGVACKIDNLIAKSQVREYPTSRMRGGVGLNSPSIIEASKEHYAHDMQVGGRYRAQGDDPRVVTALAQSKRWSDHPSNAFGTFNSVCSDLTATGAAPRRLAITENWRSSVPLDGDALTVSGRLQMAGEGAIWFGVDGGADMPDRIGGRTNIYEDPSLAAPFRFDTTQTGVNGEVVEVWTERYTHILGSSGLFRRRAADMIEDLPISFYSVTTIRRSPEWLDCPIPGPGDELHPGDGVWLRIGLGQTNNALIPSPVTAELITGGDENGSGRYGRNGDTIEYPAVDKNLVNCSGEIANLVGRAQPYNYTGLPGQVDIPHLWGGGNEPSAIMQHGVIAVGGRAYGGIVLLYSASREAFLGCQAQLHEREFYVAFTKAGSEELSACKTQSALAGLTADASHWITGLTEALRVRPWAGGILEMDSPEVNPAYNAWRISDQDEDKALLITRPESNRFFAMIAGQDIVADHHGPTRVFVKGMIVSGDGPSKALSTLGTTQMIPWFSTREGVQEIDGVMDAKQNVYTTALVQDTENLPLENGQVAKGAMRLLVARNFNFPVLAAHGVHNVALVSDDQWVENATDASVVVSYEDRTYPVDVDTYRCQRGDGDRTYRIVGAD